MRDCNLKPSTLSPKKTAASLTTVAGVNNNNTFFWYVGPRPVLVNEDDSAILENYNSQSATGISME